jgi:hypothetical protein
MKYDHFILILFFALFITSGCKKDLDNSCRELREAIQTNDISKAGSAITRFIKRLPSDVNSSENLQHLATTISDNCSLTAQVLCFGCIQTLPEQSEIRITLNSGSTSLSKTIDISYTSNNRMKFVYMHD